MAQFHDLKVVDVKRETVDTVSVGFEIPGNLKSDFAFTAGQYLTLSFDINGNEERRAYSLCSAPSEEVLRVAVKQVDGGKVSTHINQNLNAGDVVKVMAPEGGFVLASNAGNAKTYVAFAAGSGITPMLSMAKVVKNEEPNSKFVLFYGNKDAENTIFKTEFDGMQGSNVTTSYIFSRQDSGDALTNGRIDEAKAKALIERAGLTGADAFYLCGPEEMIVNATKGIEACGVAKDKVHYELFTTPVLMEGGATPEYDGDFEGTAKITVVYDDEEFSFDLDRNGESILETAIEEGVDVPFSCKGAVCCTCKAKVVEGKAVMDANYALTDQEVEEGYVLTCTAHPVTPTVKVDYDDI